jgi:cytochrome P450
MIGSSRVCPIWGLRWRSPIAGAGPFGGGPRICIGNSFAIAEAQIILAAIAQRYRVHLAPNHVVQPIGLVTLRPKNGIWVTLEARTPGAAIRRASPGKRSY